MCLSKSDQALETAGPTTSHFANEEAEIQRREGETCKTTKRRGRTRTQGPCLLAQPWMRGEREAWCVLAFSVWRCVCMSVNVRSTDDGFALREFGSVRVGGWGTTQGARWGEGQLSQASYVWDPLLYFLRTRPGGTLPNATFCLIPGNHPDALHFLQALQVQPRLRHPLLLSATLRSWQGTLGSGQREGAASGPSLSSTVTTPSVEQPTLPQKPLFSPFFAPCPQPKQLLIWNQGRGDVCGRGLGSPVTPLSPRLAASLCFSALGGSCLSPRSSIGPRRPL